MVPSSRKERNIRLNKTLKQLCNDPEAFAHFKRLAQQFVTGQAQATTLHDDFFTLFPDQHDLFAEMASLLPNAALSNDLMATVRQSVSTQATQPSTASPQRPSAHPPSATPLTVPTPSNPAPPAPEQLPIPAWILNDGIPPNSATARPAKGLRQTTKAGPAGDGTGVAAQGGADDTSTSNSRGPTTGPTSGRNRGPTSFDAHPTRGPTRGPNVVVWLRQDLRLHDNPALTRAAALATKQGGGVVLVFVSSVEEDGQPLESNSGVWGGDRGVVVVCVE